MKGFYRPLAVLAVPAILCASLSFTKVFAEDMDADTIYSQLCVLCHGADGKATDQGKEFGSPDFNDAEWQTTRTDDDLIKSMSEGTDNENYGPVADLVKEMLEIDVDVKIFIPTIRAFAH
jgi:cytochrome c553